jgi:8-oxo-dGTP diphosphatase
MTAHGPRLGVAVLVEDEMGRLLLGQRGKEPHLGRWVIPGGGVEAGESWPAAAEREILEETGLQVTVSVRQRPHLLEILAPGEHRVILCVRGTWVSGEVRATSDLLDARFFSFTEIAAANAAGLLSPVIRPVLVATGWLAGPPAP